MKKFLPILIAAFITLSFSGCSMLELLKKDEPIQSNQKITIDNFCDYEIKAALILDFVNDQNVQFSKNEELKYLCLIVNMKNLSSKEINTSECITAELVFNEKQEYKNIKYDIANKSDISGIVLGEPKLMPLKESRVYCVAEIPNEVAMQPEKIQLKINLKNNSYVYNENIVPAYEYVDRISDLSNRYYEEFCFINDNINQSNISMAFDKTNAINSLLETATSVNSKMIEIINEMSELTPPSYYQEGYDALKLHIGIFADAINEICIGGNTQDLNTLSNALIKSGEKLSSDEYRTSIETAVNNMSFLRDTNIRNLVDD